MFNNYRKPNQAQVEQARKAVPYTITPIGGKEELLLWKKDRERLEAEWQAAQEPARKQRLAKAVSAVANQNADLQLSAIERAEVAYLPTRTPSAFVPQTPSWILTPEAPKPPTLGEKIEKLAAKLWRTAFPE